MISHAAEAEDTLHPQKLDQVRECVEELNVFHVGTIGLIVSGQVWRESELVGSKLASILNHPGMRDDFAIVFLESGCIKGVINAPRGGGSATVDQCFVVSEI